MQSNELLLADKTQNSNWNISSSKPCSAKVQKNLYYSFKYSFTSHNWHLLTETEGNSMFFGPEIVDVSRGEAEGNIGSRGSTKHTASLGLSQ